MAKESKGATKTPEWETLEGEELAAMLAASVERHFRGVNYDGSPRSGFNTGDTMRNANQLSRMAVRVLRDPQYADTKAAAQLPLQPLPYAPPSREAIEEPASEEAA